MVKLEGKLSNEVVQEIIRMYSTELHSIKDISRSFSELKISETGIKGLLKRAGIQIRSLSDSTKLSYTHHVHSGIGKKYSSERCKKISQTRKSKGIKPACTFPKGYKPWNTGKRIPTMGGAGNPNWRGGKTPLAKMIRELPEYRNWRKAIYERDDYTCTICGVIGGRLNADHIKMFVTIISDNNINDLEAARDCSELWDIDNGRTLCEPCHRLTDTFGVKGNGIVRTLNKNKI